MKKESSRGRLRGVMTIDNIEAHLYEAAGIAPQEDSR